MFNLKQFDFQGLAFHLSTPALWSRLYSWAGSGKIGQMDLEIDIFWIVYFFWNIKRLGTAQMASWSIWTGSTFRERGDFTGIFFIIYSILLKCLDDWGLCRIANRLRGEDLVVATKWTFVRSKSTNVNPNEKVERNGRFSCESKHGPCGGEQLHGVALVRYKTIWKYEIIDKSAIPANSIFFFQAGHLFTSCTWGEKPELKEERKFEEFYSKYKFRKYWPAVLNCWQCLIRWS